MVFFNYALRKLNAKIVYYGPGLCGKTTNLQWIHDHFEGGQRGKMLSLATEGDRTIFFDLLPLEIGTIRGMQVTLQLYTVPGQVHYNSTRQLVLRGADGVVFVADSQRTMARSNVESVKNLEENLLLQGVDLKGFPCVLQFNKRDLRDVMSVDELDQVLNRYSAPIFEAIATSGVGVQETLEGIVKLVMRSLRERYEPMVAAGHRVPEMPVAPSGPRPVIPPPGLRPPTSPVAAPVAPPTARRVAPPTPVAPPAGYDPRATTVDLQAATQPPAEVEVAAAIAPPAVSTKPGPSVEFVLPDDTPTAVFTTPETLQDALAGEELTFEHVGAEGFADEVTATGMPIGEAIFLRPGPPTGGELFGEPALPVPDEEAAPEQALDLSASLPEAPAEAFLAADARVPVFDEPSAAHGDEGGPADLGQVVLDRAEEESYQDHVRAPGPFAEITLDREAPFAEGESEAGAEAAPFADAVAAPRDAFLPEERRRPGGVDVEVAPEAAVARGEQPFASAEELPAGDEEELGPPKTYTVRRVESAVDDLVASVMKGRPRPGTAPDQLEVAQPLVESVPLAPVPPLVVAPTAPSPPPAARSVWLAEGDPFALEEEPAFPPVLEVGEVEPMVAPPVEVVEPTRSAIQVHAHSNQLRVQLQGSGALAEYGEVREMDIVVPVPGPWIGNRRVTIQLRLTLTPAAEEGDDGSSDAS